MKTRAFVIGLLVTVVLVFTNCSNPCENEIVTESNSPDGKFRAIVFHRGCGATVGFNTQVTLLATEEILGDSTGNILIIDGLWADIAWEDASNLVVQHPPGVRVYHQANEILGVAIEFQSVDQPAS